MITTLDTLEDKRAQVECSDYSPLPESARCKHYHKNGSCDLPSYMMCVEWLKRNPNQQLTAPPETPIQEHPIGGKKEASGASEKPRAKPLRTVEPTVAHYGTNSGSPTQSRHLLGGGKSPKVAQRDIPYSLSSLPPIDESAALVPALIGNAELLTEEQVDALANLGLEVRLDTGEGGMVTLVPQYTGAERVELSYRDCRTLVTCLQVFPGAKLQAIVAKKEKKASALLVGVVDEVSQQQNQENN